MTDIIFHRAKLTKGKITYEPIKVNQLDIHFAGEDGQYLWLEMTLEDGSKEQTPYYKGVS